jgi:acyl carrier protein
MTTTTRESMSREIDSQVIALIAATLHVDSRMIRPEASLAGDLGADSLRLVELILAIEDELNIDIPDEDAAEISTVQQMIEYVTIALALKAPATAQRSTKSVALGQR